MVWDASSGSGRTLDSVGSRVLALAFDPPGDVLAVGTNDGTIIYDLRGNRRVATAASGGKPVGALAVGVRRRSWRPSSAEAG